MMEKSGNLGMEVESELPRLWQDMPEIANITCSGDTTEPTNLNISYGNTTNAIYIVFENFIISVMHSVVNRNMHQISIVSVVW